MKIVREEIDHGWRAEITDPVTKEKWQGNIYPLQGEADKSARDGFIEDKKKTITDLKKQIKAHENSITKLLNLL